MSEAKRALLEKYLRGDLKHQATSPRTITARPTDQAPQLSFAQQRLWFLDQLMPGSAVFNVPLSVRLTGQIDLSALERSINEIVRRHDALRTTFAIVDGQPVPVIAPLLSVDLPVADLRSSPESERETNAHTLLSKEAATPFDLAQGPLIRTVLLRLDESRHHFLVVMHHIVSDGWSLVLFFEELATLYAAFSRGDASPLTELSIQYIDYAAWQREWLRGEVLQKQLSYWKEQLGGDLPVLDLPTDRRRPALQTFSGAREWLVLSDDLTASVVSLGQREGATLFMTLLAAFKVLLYRYTGQEDIIVGSPIANRPQTETESLIGFFLNNLALRTELSGNLNFREVLARVGKTALQAYEHQDVAFEKLIEELKPVRDLSRTPVFQVYFNLFNFADEIKLPGTSRTISFVEAWSHSDEELSKFDLTLYAGLQDRKLKLAFVYNTDLFDAASIRAMLAHLGVLLEGVVANPGSNISDFSLRTEAKAHGDLLRSNRVCPNNAFTEFEKEEIEQSIADRFSSQAEKYTNKIAVKSRNHEWTYAELNAAANRVAESILCTHGPGSERIALLFEHDAPMIAGMLGALKAGKTYVPLDPHHPKERLAHIIKHSQATAILTDNQNLSLASELAKDGVQLINFDNADSTAPLVDLPAIEPERLAYILYTSGSTGQPKGVMQNHRNVLHYIRVYTNNLHINAGDRLTLLSSYCFDAAVMDIYGALLNGATLCPIDIREDGLAELARQLTAEEITIYHSTPTVYRYFVDSLKGPLETGKFPCLRLVVLGGEEVNRTDVELYKRHFSDDCLFVNGLGPTEATVSLQHFIDKHTELTGESVPVGLAVQDTEVLLLNRAGEPAEISGEIAIKSAYVALGYWRNPEATKAAFMTNGSGPAIRIYRTGDMGRRLADGRIKFAGRKDFQVKIRGFRVELGEIESALSQHWLVRECIVVARENNAGDKQLVAYVVPRQKQSTIAGELRDLLKQKLPEYMVPSSFVLLDSMPLTASGKMNRGALPAPNEFSDRPLATSATPQTPLEKLLSDVWADLLTVKVGVNDNFFELGGHSLLAVRLFAQIEKKFGKRLPLATLFQAPTVAQLAAILQKDWTPPWSSLVAIQAAGSKPPFFCVHALGGNVLEYYGLALHLGMDQPFYALQSQGLDGQRPPHTRIEEMAAHYIKEMRELQPHGPYFIGGRSLGGTVAFEMARQLRAHGEEIGLLALLDSYPAGYSKLLKVSATLRPKRSRLGRRIKSHLANLGTLSIQEKLSYVFEKARFGPGMIKSHLWRKVYRSYETLGRPLPPVLNDVREFNSMAAREYVPQVYDGPITLFWASRDLRASYDLVEGWRALAAGEIEVHEIPGTHLDIIEEPHVAELARKLDSCLDRAQARRALTIGAA
ncbi:MAG TPA: amino acid adenylation domain-containing protein [Pyrinomonadaceae bacterium]|nr:amino acid adenylation domain-containing protein [Pyrinomonadaceae bacterium]